MEHDHSLFDSLLFKLNEMKLLPDIILIGSWCLPFYKEIYNNTHEIEQLRTLDVDILFRNPPKVNVHVDFTGELKDLGFTYIEDCSTHIGKIQAQ